MCFLTVAIASGVSIYRLLQFKCEINRNVKINNFRQHEGTIEPTFNLQTTRAHTFS